MKFLSAILAAFLCLPAWASDPTAESSFGLHGMLLFGGADGLYASHLPMFHKPHDAQVVFALRIADPRLERKLRWDVGAKPKVWTLVPEKFELSRLAPDSVNPLRSFKADVVEGHFERGGKTRLKDVTVQVVQMLRYQPLDPNAPPARIAHYRAVGRGDTWFLVKDIEGRPSYDHVIELRGANKPEDVDVPVNGVKMPPMSAFKGKLPKHDRVLKTVYYETDDLK
ncbi:hypothetical protein [Piscinibacter terrae]|uniref:START domain-containing protein n=1 Tax=Piscinibacter terrae TaxID=2496871 RepID=A0A3N7HHR6_9BURK|nr:hypothetical protein [Albitalea terrae]RQP21594.1 hypothetical protein DZC73_27180 [Albitalea terrae]